MAVHGGYTMVGFTITSLLTTPSLSNPITLLSRPRHHHLLSFDFPLTLKLKPEPPISMKSPPLVVFAANNNNDDDEEVRERGDKQEQQASDPKGEDVSNKEQRRPIFSFNLSTLFDPDPDNVIAIGLSGLLTWASVQVLWQLLFISLAILVAALKYSFIAVLLIFILITLL